MILSSSNISLTFFLGSITHGCVNNEFSSLNLLILPILIFLIISSDFPVFFNSCDIKEVLEKEESLISEELKSAGKPEQIVKKISIGKINKFKEENALLSQSWVMEPNKKVQDILKELSIADLKIKDFYRLKIGE